MAKHHMTPDERAEYDGYMSEGISELRRLWFDGGAGQVLEDGERENPGSMLWDVLTLALLGGVAVAGIHFWPQIKAEFEKLAPSTTYARPVIGAPSGVAVPTTPTTATCAPGDYRRHDGVVVTLDQIHQGLIGAGYPGPWDTASVVQAYSRADPTGAGALTAC